MNIRHALSDAFWQSIVWATRKLFGRDEWKSPERDYWIAVMEAQERDIGRAFAGCLLSRLPWGLTGLSDLPPVEDIQREYLERHPSVVTAGPAGTTLARVGLTPVTVASAAFAISCLVTREGGADRPLTLSCVPGNDGDVTRAKIVEEVAMYCEITPGRATALADWLMAAAGIVTRLFPDYAAARNGDLIVLTWDGHEDHDLGIGWSL